MTAAVDPAILAETATNLARTGPVTFDVDGRIFSYLADGSTIRQIDGEADGATVVRMDQEAWDDLVSQLRTVMNLVLTNELEFVRGGFEQLADWEPVLKYLHAGIPPYRPGRSDLKGLDPTASFTLDDDDSVLRRQLQTLGYLHVRHVFNAEEMRAANADIDRLAAAARPGDDQSWWVSAQDGSTVLCRLVYATLRSPVLAAIEADPRVRRLGALLDPALRAATDRMEGTSVLLKVPGQTSGLSNLPWHQDCGLGGHAITCPAAAVGIQLTGSDAATGNLRVIPASHGQSVHYAWLNRHDVDYVTVDTEPGDVIVHVTDVLHASPQPTGAGGRRTMYVTHYPPQLWEHIGPGEAYNDLVRNRTEQVSDMQGGAQSR